MFVLNEYVSPDKFEQFWSYPFLLHTIIINDNDNNITCLEQYKYLKGSMLIIYSVFPLDIQRWKENNKREGIKERHSRGVCAVGWKLSAEW